MSDDTLNDRLLVHFLDGRLADAVEILAEDTKESVPQACLYEAAARLRAAAELYEALDQLLANARSYKRKPTFEWTGDIRHPVLKRP